MTTVKIRKRTITIDFWPGDTSSRSNLGSNGRTYEGRLLGLITDKEFASLVSNVDIQKKCYTSATMPLSEVVDNYEDLEGYRIAVAVKKVDSVPVTGQKLFITERLSLISYLNTDRSAGITGENGAYMMVEEEVTDNGA